MKILIAEDDQISRKFLFKLLSQYGECDLVMDGFETLDAYLLSLKENKPYDLICLDVMMPKVNGIKVLKAIRQLETRYEILAEQQAKIIMTTALTEKEFGGDFQWCNGFITKPINADEFIAMLKEIQVL
jgi:two-component system chemotaxis response regulator CheY